MAVLCVVGAYLLGTLPTATAARGTDAAIIGYPGGGPEQTVAAVVERGVTTRESDIYGGQPANRSVWIVNGAARPGNSGWPLVDAAGRVLGVVYAVSQTDSSETYALTNATLPYVVELADHGWHAALAADPALALGLNTHEGQLTNEPVAAAHGYESVPVATALS